MKYGNIVRRSNNFVAVFVTKAFTAGLIEPTGESVWKKMMTSESPIAMSLVQVLPSRLNNHSYSIIELAQEMAQEFECPICEILDPMGAALQELIALHTVVFDSGQKRVVLV
ncbi:MAG: hypothetical protein AAGE59_18450 [Cyanobacteria bacterium P01_F01_bin.86]